MATDDDLTVARDLAIDACGRIAEFWGFTRTMGRAFGLLYLSREPLAQSELQERLGISAGSASMTLAALGRWGVVHKVWVRGQRREHYQAETDFWKMISGVLNERERREIGAAVEVVGRAEKAARAAQAAHGAAAAPRRGPRPRPTSSSSGSPGSARFAGSARRCSTCCSASSRSTSGASGTPSRSPPSLEPPAPRESATRRRPARAHRRRR